MEGHCKRTSGGRTKVQVAAKEIQTRYKEKTCQGVVKSGIGCPEKPWDVHPWRHSCSALPYSPPELGLLFLNVSSEDSP